MTPDECDRIIAANIRAERARTGVPQRELAARMNEAGHETWRPQTVSNVETASRRVLATEVIALSEILNVPVAVLMAVNGRGGTDGLH